MDVLQSKKEPRKYRKYDQVNINKIYYSPKELCAIINDSLGLSAIDYINSVHLFDWRKKKWIDYKKNISGKIHVDDIEKIREFVFFHVALGVKFNKIKAVKQYLRENIDNKNSELIKYIYEVTK